MSKHYQRFNKFGELTVSYKGYDIVHTFGKQWDATARRDPDNHCIHIFRTLKQAKAWIDSESL